MGQSKKRSTNASLGNSLRNKQSERRPNTRDGENAEGFKVHTSDIITVTKPALHSILEQNSLEEFMQYAELSQKMFTAERTAQ